MATRFDRVTTSTRTLEADLEVGALVPRRDLLPVHVPRAVPVRAMGGAMVTWLGLVFAGCYVVGPVLLAVTGINFGVIAGLAYSLPAFAMASLVAVVAALLARPQIRLDLRGPRDPVISATLGGLGVWALIHNTSSLLVPFTQMRPLELASLIGLNLVEMTLLGMMFASFTQRRSVALALGGGFQLLMLGLVLTLLAL